MFDLTRLEWILIIGFGAVCYFISDGVRRIINALIHVDERIGRFEEKYLDDDDLDD